MNQTSTITNQPAMQLLMEALYKKGVQTIAIEGETLVFGHGITADFESDRFIVKDEGRLQKCAYQTDAVGIEMGARWVHYNLKNAVLKCELRHYLEEMGHLNLL